jgi:hypothetical protein
MHVYMFAPNNLITSAPEHAIYIGMVYCAQILFFLTSFFGKKNSQISYNVLENKWWRPYQFLAHYFFKLKLYDWLSVYFETYFKTSLSNTYVLFLFCQIGCTIFFNCPRPIHLLATCWHFSLGLKQSKTITFMLFIFQTGCVIYLSTPIKLQCYVRWYVRRHRHKTVLPSIAKEISPHRNEKAQPGLEKNSWKQSGNKPIDKPIHGKSYLMPSASIRGPTRTYSFSYFLNGPAHKYSTH